MNNKKLISITSDISLALLCAYLFDCAWSGAGRWFMFGPVSIRMILLGSAMLLSVPGILFQIRLIFCNKFTLCLFGFLGLLIVNAIRGIQNGADLSILSSDLKGFSYYLMYPALLVIIDSKKRVVWAMKAIIAGCAFQALFIMLIFIDYIIPGFPLTINQHLQTLSDLRIFVFNPMGGNLIRIFAFSALYLIPGCIFAAYLFIVDDKWKWCYPVLSGLFLFVLMINFTRSLYFGLAVAFLFTLLLFPCLRVRRSWIIKYLLSTVLVFAVILVPLSLVGRINYFSYAVEKTLLTLERSDAASDVTDSTEESILGDEAVSADAVEATGPATPVEETDLAEATVTPAAGNMATETAVPDQITSSPDETSSPIEKSFEITLQSDQLRSVTLRELREKIAQHPLFGAGLGAAVECRAGGITEYFFLDFLHKTGIVGLFIYFTPLILLLICAVRRKMQKSTNSAEDMKSLFTCGLLSFMAVSFFNPYMNAALGVTMFSLTMAVNSIVDSEKVLDENNAE